MLSSPRPRSDPPAGRQSLGRPVPIQVRIRKLDDSALPRKLAPRFIAFRWTLEWDSTLTDALTVTSFEIRPPEPAPTRVSAPATAPEQPRPAVRVEPEIDAPHLIIEPSQFGIWARFSTAKKIGLATAMALVLAASAAWKLIDNSGASPTRQAPSAPASNPLAGFMPSLNAGPGGWVSEAAGDAGGMAAGRRMTLYSPSRRLSDYVVDFSGYLQSKSLGWVFRFQDARNYYATNIEITRPGPMPEIALVRWAVSEGEEVARNSVTLPLVVHSDMLYRVRFEVKGPRFATYLQGRAMDLWSDTRIKQGAFGFMNDREARAEIKSVQFWLPAGPAGR